MKPFLNRDEIPKIRNQRQQRHAGLLNGTLDSLNIFNDAAFPFSVLRRDRLKPEEIVEFIKTHPPIVNNPAPVH